MPPHSPPCDLAQLARQWPVHLTAVAAAQTAHKAARLQPYWASMTVDLQQADSTIKSLLEAHPEARHGKLGRHAIRPLAERTALLLAFSAKPSTPAGAAITERCVDLLLLSSHPGEELSHAYRDGVTWGPLTATAEPVSDEPDALVRLRWNVTGRMTRATTIPLEDLEGREALRMLGLAQGKEN